MHNIKTTVIKMLVLALLLLVLPFVYQAGSGRVYATDQTEIGNGGASASSSSSSSAAPDPAATSGNCSDIKQCDLVSKYVNPLIAFLGALVGVAVVASIISGAIQYAGSAGDPQRVAAGKKHIFNAIFALLIFLMLMALLNFLVPGGI